MSHPELTYKLLNHPFYQSWNCGHVTKDQLAKYGRSYLKFISEMPNLWERVLNDLPRSLSGSEEIVEDETRHIALWQEWTNKLSPTNDLSGMEECLKTFASLSGAELLGALQAFEVQQPEVAVTKKEGLLKHYGFSEEDLNYFDEHMNEHHHIALGNKARDLFNDEAAYNRGFQIGQKAVYEALDAFVA